MTESVALTDPATAFRGVAGQLATPVAVVMTLLDGMPAAATISSVVAASWQPPLLAIMLRRGSGIEAALGASGRFTVNVLGEADHALARRWARPGRERSWDAFADIPLRRRDPLPPLLTGAVVWADCLVAQSFIVGDHRCIVGDVIAADRNHEAAPLVYYRGRFRGLGPGLAPAAWSLADTTELAASW